MCYTLTNHGDSVPHLIHYLLWVNINWLRLVFQPTSKVLQSQFCSFLSLSLARSLFFISSFDHSFLMRCSECFYFSLLLSFSISSFFRGRKKRIPGNNNNSNETHLRSVVVTPWLYLNLASTLGQQRLSIVSLYVTNHPFSIMHSIPKPILSRILLSEIHTALPCHAICIAH